MRRRRSVLMVALVIIGGLGILAGMFSAPVVAQVRAALVRDVDTPALSPFRFGVQYSLTAINEQRLLTTVPPGKRLVIEYISWWGYSAVGTELVYGGLRVGQFGPNSVMLQVNPPHASATPGSFTIQDGSQVVKAYFEAGEEVWASVSKSAGGAASIEIRVHGHLVTP